MALYSLYLKKKMFKLFIYPGHVQWVSKKYITLHGFFRLSYVSLYLHKLALYQAYQWPYIPLYFLGRPISPYIFTNYPYIRLTSGPIFPIFCLLTNLFLVFLTESHTNSTIEGAILQYLQRVGDNLQPVVGSIGSEVNAAAKINETVTAYGDPRNGGGESVF